MQPFQGVFNGLATPPCTDESPGGSIYTSGNLITWEVILFIFEFVSSGWCAVGPGEIVPKKVKEKYPCPCFALQ
jgi:hypothetical protein